MKIEEHLAAYEEHKEAIFKWALEIKGLEHAQRIVGLHASRGIAELLSAFLHKKKLVDVGFQLNHRWFKSARVKARLPDFRGKDEIVSKLVKLENESEALTYGSPKHHDKIKKAIVLFRDLEKNLLEMLK